MHKRIVPSPFGTSNKRSLPTSTPTAARHCALSLISSAREHRNVRVHIKAERERARVGSARAMLHIVIKYAAQANCRRESESGRARHTESAACAAVSAHFVPFRFAARFENEFNFNLVFSSFSFSFSVSVAIRQRWRAEQRPNRAEPSRAGAECSAQRIFSWICADRNGFIK